MRLLRFVKALAGTALIAGVATAGYFTRDRWLPLVTPTPASAGGSEGMSEQTPAGEVQQVRLTPQAQANLRLVTKPLKPDTYWRTVELPGTVVDRPARSDRGVIAPVTAVVTKVHQFPGDTVRPGDPLFTLRLLSETLHLTQSDLFKTTQEIQITREQKERLTAPALGGAVPEAKIIELDNQIRRLTVAAQAYRQELQTRGLSPDQIDGVGQGKFVSEIRVVTPPQAEPSREPGGSPNLFTSTQTQVTNGPAFEVQELKVELGQQVQAGQTLALLSDHRSLYVEGRAFRSETPLLERAVKEGWPVEVDFLEDEAAGWPPLGQTFTIRHIANTIDPATRTFAFFLPLQNQSLGVERDGRSVLLWRFRPGQKVRLHVRVEKIDDVFVLPADAVVREGPEAYVFRQNGELFDRKPVRVVHQDRRHVVASNDGSVPPGLYVAQNGAVQLNRALKARSGGTPGVHVHADGSVHENH